MFVLFRKEKKEKYIRRIKEKLRIFFLEIIIALFCHVEVNRKMEHKSGVIFLEFCKARSDF